MRYANLFDFWFGKMRNLYACLMFLIQLWATEIDIVLFLSGLVVRKSA